MPTTPQERAKWKRLFQGLYKRGDEGRIYTRFSCNGRIVFRTTGTDNLEEARKRQKAIQKQVRNSEPVEPKTTVAGFAQIWLELYCSKRDKYFLQTTTTRVRKYLVPFMGKEALTSIKTEDLLHYRNYLQSDNFDLANSTVKAILSDLRCLLNFAVRTNKINKSPFRAKEIMPKLKKSKPKDLDKQQILAIRANASPPALAAIKLAYMTGARWGELKKMKWSDIYGDKIILDETKSGEIRTVFLSTEAIQHLEWIKETFPMTEYVLPQRPRGPMQFVGRFHKFTKEFSYFCGFKWNFHQLRHTYAFNCLNKGVPVDVLQKLLGHSSPEMTQRYARLADATVGDVFKRVMG